MSNLKSRLVKLESSMLNDPEPVRIARFIVAPGNLAPAGYQCGDIKIMRCHDESEASFKQRCLDAVTWPDGNYRQVFDMLEYNVIM